MIEYRDAILKTIIPTTLIYAGRTDDFFLFLKQHNLLFDSNADISPYKLVSFIIGLFWTGIITPIQLEKIKKKYTDKQNVFIQLLGIYKETYIKSVKEKLNINSSQINTRVFVKKNSFKYWLKRKFRNEIFFELKEIKGISDKINVDKLEFKVSPNPEGLIGKSFTENKAILDMNLTSEKYNLSAYQKYKTSDIKFCCVAPVYNHENEIIAMISLDSTKKIKINDENQLKLWTELIQDYCAIIDKFINN